MRDTPTTVRNLCQAKHHVGLQVVFRGLSFAAFSFLVVCAMAFCGGRLAFAAQESALSITVASDSHCRLCVNSVKLDSDGDMRVNLTLHNREYEDLKLTADDDWTCNGKSAHVIMGVIYADAGESCDNYFYVKNVDLSKGGVEVRGTMLLKDEDYNVVARYSFNSGKITFSAQDRMLPITVASDDLCRLTVTKAKLCENGNLGFYYTLCNRSDEEFDLRADDDWECDGRSVHTVTGYPSVAAGKYRDDNFFVEDVKTSKGSLAVKGSLLLVDEDGNVVARYWFDFEDPEHIEGFEKSGNTRGSVSNSHIDGGEFLRVWCGAYYYKIGMRYPEAWSSDVRFGWLSKVRSYVNQSSDLCSALEGRYDYTLKGTLTCVMDTKSLQVSGSYEKYEVTVRRAVGGWDDFTDTTEYWLVYYADDGKVCQVQKTALSPKAT